MVMRFEPVSPRPGRPCPARHRYPGIDTVCGSPATGLVLRRRPGPGQGPGGPGPLDPDWKNVGAACSQSCPSGPGGRPPRTADMSARIGRETRGARRAPRAPRGPRDRAGPQGTAGHRRAPQGRPWRPGRRVQNNARRDSSLAKQFERRCMQAARALPCQVVVPSAAGALSGPGDLCQWPKPWTCFFLEIRKIELVANVWFGIDSRSLNDCGSKRVQSLRRLHRSSGARHASLRPAPRRAGAVTASSRLILFKRSSGR